MRTSRYHKITRFRLRNSRKALSKRPPRAGKSRKAGTLTAEERELIEMASSLPDVRQEKVESIRKLIQSGEYRVPSDLVAESIIRLHKDLTSDDN